MRVGLSRGGFGPPYCRRPIFAGIERSETLSFVESARAKPSL